MMSPPSLETGGPQAPASLPPWGFAARIGHVLVAPQRALLRMDALGGGFQDAVVLTLLGVVCFWMRDLVEALLALSHLPLADVLSRLLQLASLAFRDAATVVVPAAVGLTVLAGHGRRDPSRDLELGAACYVPFFTVKGAERMLSLDAVMGPLPHSAYTLGSFIAVAWALAIFVLALRVARAREIGAQARQVAHPTREREVMFAQAPRWRWALASGCLAGILCVAAVVNGLWVLRNANAVKPFARGDAVPAFTLEQANGSNAMVSLDSFKGKVVLLDFWASWCGPCLQLAPVLSELRTTWLDKGFEVVSINTDLNMQELNLFLQQHPAPYPVLMADPAGRVVERFKVVNLPHLVFLNQKGHVAQTFWGYKSRAQLERVVQELLAAPQP